MFSRLENMSLIFYYTCYTIVHRSQCIRSVLRIYSSSSVVDVSGVINNGGRGLSGYEYFLYAVHVIWNWHLKRRGLFQFITIFFKYLLT